VCDATNRSLTPEPAGTSAAGECIAAGTQLGVKAIEMWWHSPGHLKNLMGKNHGRVGVGQEQKHYTQMFGK